MKTKLLKVITPNKMLFIKGRLVRTPLEAIIKYEKDLNKLKSSMINQSIEFEIENYNPVVKKQKEVIIEELPKDVVKEKKEPETLLEKIAAEKD